MELRATWAGTGDAELSRAGETAVTRVSAQTVPLVERMLDGARHDFCGSSAQPFAPKLFRRGIDRLRNSCAFQGLSKRGANQTEPTIPWLSRP